MEKPQILFLFLLSIAGACFTGCVSVQIPSGQAIRAPKVQFKEPGDPFRATNSENADKAWQSKPTGNTIAYFSNCNPAVDPPLKDLALESTSALSDLKTLESHEDLAFEGREALEQIVSGKIDGVPAKLWILVFKKNGCNFTLSFMGSAKTFDQEKNYFSEFKRAFQVPVW